MPSGSPARAVTERPATGAPPLSPDELRLTDAYWRAANYLTVGQIYLISNPLLAEPLRRRYFLVVVTGAGVVFASVPVKVPFELCLTRYVLPFVVVV